ncbi:MAG: SDR family oxidoreductase [Lachnospiraceae bacterium]|nr:SDR family oxidoreductase [Lachnospiraceae bacterium]
MRLKDKVSIITGGASGIGKATVIRFAEEGAKVVFCCRSKDKAAAFMEELKAAGLSENVRYFSCDVSKEEDVIALCEYTKSEFGNCEILFNNAGVHQAGKLHETSLADWDRIMNIDLRGVYLMCYHILPQMIEKQYGSIINMSSVSGIAADYAMCAYNTAKGAITNLTRSMALDYAGDNIRVNAVCPGIIRTEIAEHTFTCVPGSEDMFRDAYPVHYIADPVEVANAVVFLAARESDFITGVNLPIDGGITCHTGQPCTGTY